MYMSEGEGPDSSIIQTLHVGSHDEWPGPMIMALLMNT